MEKHLTAPNIKKIVIRGINYAGLIAVLILFSFSTVFGGAYDQLPGSGSSPNFPTPQPSPPPGGGGGGGGGGEHQGSGNSSSGNYSQRLLEYAYQYNQKGNEEYNKGNWLMAIKYYRAALKCSPNDQVIKDNLKSAEDHYAQQKHTNDLDKQNQKAFEKEARDDAEYVRKERQNILSLMNPLKPPQTQQSSAGGIKHIIPPLPKPEGLSENEWRELLRCVEEVYQLYAKLNTKGSLSDAEAQRFFEVLGQRNALWAKTVSEPLTAVERDRLRLTLPVNERQVVSAEDAKGPYHSVDRRADTQSSSEHDSIITGIAADYSIEETEKFLDTKAKEWLKKKAGEKITDRPHDNYDKKILQDKFVGDYEDLLEVSRIAVSGAKDGAAAAGAKTVDFVIEKVLEPTWSARAKLARDTGRIYSNTTYQAFDQFMDSVNVFGEKVGMEKIDKEKFRKKLNENMTAMQKGAWRWLCPRYFDEKK